MRRRDFTNAAVLAATGPAWMAQMLTSSAQTRTNAGVPATMSGSAPMMSDVMLRDIGVEAYIFGFPMVLMERTRRIQTNVTAANAAGAGGSAPMNQIAHARAFPPADFKGVVRPNFDTLYSIAWLDVSSEPMMLTLPRTDRYHVFPIMDAWSNVFAAPGSRMDGGSGGPWLIAGPGWNGDVPAGLRVLRCPTNIAWMIGRIQTNGVADYSTVHALQAEIKLVPLSAYGRPWSPPAGIVDPAVDMKTAPMNAVLAMDGRSFFTQMMAAMRNNPPNLHDAGVATRMDRVGLRPGMFDWDSLPAATRAALDAAVADGQRAIRARGATLARKVNGWQLVGGAVGYFGGDYAFRAVIALAGLGAVRPEDGMYPSTTEDGAGRPLDGASRYTITFASGQTPPVDAFWSITTYDQDGFTVPNAINRLAIGDRDPLRRNADGSITLLLQSASPGAGQEANWLPTPPSGPFSLTLRAYGPKPALVSGAWSPPPVLRAGP